MKRLLAAVLVLVCGAAFGQAYPSRTIRIIVPNAAGGPSDLVGRLMAQKLTEAWGQPAIVENRVGAGGNIGADGVAKAAPDGYTLLVTNSAPVVINQHVYAKMPYDPVKDLVPVSLLASAPFSLATTPAIPAKSVGEFIQFLKRNPGKYNFASVGGGTGPHLAAELFKAQAGIDVVHVPYRSVPLALAALMTGEVAYLIISIDGVLPQAKAGKINALAVTSRSRSALAPELPTLAESGMPDYEVLGWYGLLAPSGTSREILARLHGEAARIFGQPDVRQRMTAIGFESVASSPEQFAAHIGAESARWAKVASSLNLRIQ